VVEQAPRVPGGLRETAVFIDRPMTERSHAKQYLLANCSMAGGATGIGLYSRDLVHKGYRQVLSLASFTREFTRKRCGGNRF
jgi:hypothetical protein